MRSNVLARASRLGFAAGIAIGVLTLASSPGSAALIPIANNLDFTGSAISIGSANLWNGTGVDFFTSGLPGIGTAGSLGLNNTTSGAFTLFNPFNCPAAGSGGCGTIVDLQTFTPNSNILTISMLPVSSLLSVSQTALQTGNIARIATFTLTSFADSEIAPAGATLGTLILSGSGTMTMTGFDPTPATMTITSQGNGATSFSGTVITQVAAPEPASMLLMGVGLAGLAAVRRRSRAHTA
jgi:hypothetical protein